MSRTTVVVATRNRAGELDRTLHRLTTMDPKPPVIVLDNGSVDETARVAASYEGEGVRVIRSPRNHGAAARTQGVIAARTPYVAFSDDDSWWAADALPRAENLFDAHPGLALIAGRTLVGPDEREDPVTPALEHSPLGTPADAPGPLVLGFLACSAVVRRTAFLQAGGFSSMLHFGAEEQLLAYDLAAAGWQLCYVPDVVAHHHPSPSRPSASWRHRAEARNQLLIGWLRRPGAVCATQLRHFARSAGHEPSLLGALPTALLRLPRALARRRVLPDSVEQQARTLEG
ncbi:glycosyltransferase family 2 protein [Amycolatopsis jiangsuensis]|uniref:GT2 family glycosyltransferase n=1 Tax=Amycolatopsis jiangsuensis TaxID=1181879 RepID=A0A840J6T4_9PSEU|nr:glycosyltransferase family 2 protein [Amycolatopsis jiangsuensis]MBB4689142.1 GT2 family glycosyltransferase [Amycolatopsis jiangsuensis]